MVHSFFPRKDALLLLWALNYKARIPIYATALGLTPEQVAEQVAWCGDIIDDITSLTTQKGAVKGFVNAKNLTIGDQGGLLRVDIARQKMAIGYTETIGKDLGIIGSTVVFDPNTYKPIIHPTIFGGYIRIKFRKAGVKGINIYSRKKGSGTWVFLSRATKSPFDNHLTLQTAGQPEHWEYRAFGVINDHEIGFASDIVEIVFGT